MASTEDLAHVPVGTEPGGTRDGVFLFAKGMIVLLFDFSARVTVEQDMMPVHGGDVAYGIQTIVGMTMHGADLFQKIQDAIHGDDADGTRTFARDPFVQILGGRGCVDAAQGFGDEPAGRRIFQANGAERVEDGDGLHGSV